MTEVSVLFVTAGSEEEAARIARTLLEERLIACANLIPGVRSLYRWEGKIEDDREVLLVLKTGKAVVKRLTERIAELHGYDVPEVLELRVASGNPPYLDWVLEETKDWTYPRGETS